MDTSDQNVTLDQFMTWKTDALREYLTQRGLQKDGNKSELAALCYSAFVINFPIIPTTADILKQNKKDYQSLLFVDNVKIPDPLGLHGNWLDEVNGIAKWPPIYISDILTFMTGRDNPSDVKRVLQDYKIGKAYEYFHNGFLKEVFYHSIEPSSSLCIPRAKCTPSQKLSSEDHDVRVCAFKDTGEIKTSYCTCTAGLGGTCNHVAGLLFRVESANKLGVSSCTSVPCTWNVPSASKFKDITPSRIKDLTIVKSRHGKPANRRPLVSKVKLEYQPIQAINRNDTFNSLVTDLKKSLPNACIFKGFESQEDSEAKNIETSVRPETDIHFDIDLNKYSIENMSKQYPTGDEFLENLQEYSEPEIEAISKLTSGQSNSVNWHNLRRARITSSMLAKCTLCKQFCTCSVPDYLISDTSCNSFHLKQKHPYYTQIQGQISITGRQYCDFYVYTCNGSHQERIYFDYQYYSDILESLKFFFINYMVPELYSRNVQASLDSTVTPCTNTQSEEPMDLERTYFCPSCNHVIKNEKDVKHHKDQSIKCDVCELWFHFRCVHITKLSASKLKQWICPKCSAM